MFVMYDDVTLNEIPGQPHAVACYRNGQYANEAEARKRFPHARILPISVRDFVPCDAYDIEQGDYLPADVPGLHRVAKTAGIWRPCFYANLSTMPHVKAALADANVQRSEVRLWVAAYDGVALVPPGYDGKQFTDRALGRRLDESICLDTFFSPVGRAAPQPAPAVKRVARAVIEYDPDDGTWAIGARDSVPEKGA